MMGCELNPIEENADYDFIDHFNEAKIFPTTSDYGTPNGKLAFVMKDWDIGGEKRSAIITLADGKVTYYLDRNRRVGGEERYGV